MRNGIESSSFNVFILVKEIEFNCNRNLEGY